MSSPDWFHMPDHLRIYEAADDAVMDAVIACSVAALHEAGYTAKAYSKGLVDGVDSDAPEDVHFKAYNLARAKFGLPELPDMDTLYEYQEALIPLTERRGSP